MLTGRFHCQRHRVDESVNARADVLNIEDEDINVGDHFSGRLSGLAVKRIRGQSRPLVAKRLPLDHVVLSFASDTVLRAEQCGQLDLRMLMKYISRVLEAR